MRATKNVHFYLLRASRELKTSFFLLVHASFFSFPDQSKREAIATKLGLNKNQVKTWFAEERKSTPEELTRNPWHLPQVRVTTFGSSHADHGLPEELRKLRPQFPWCGLFDENSFDAKGGRKFRETEVEMIRQYFLFARG